MTKYREIIRLTGLGFSQRDIMASAYGHFPRPAGPHFPDSLGHIKRTAQ